ncbi:uncharacterized protein LOC123558183 [Mercenaria mercenaria]|uniref:uncharacterized protein LOC123558183 n=1 Tax=Mercenaria mercenaria TaxID=6596 RepID=UPI00234F428F|nr:uncharacterized protein LOC123558183 [Mercenaria mercenaria]
MQDSKKIGCPARWVFREICRFPKFTIDKDTPKSQRRKIAEDLQSKIRSGENVVSEWVVIAHMASIEDHTCHTLGEITPEPIDPRLAQKIAEMCQSGVTNLDAMRTLLNSYVKDICRPLPHPSNKRFYPSDKCISNHMYIFTIECAFIDE